MRYIGEIAKDWGPEVWKPFLRFEQTDERDVTIAFIHAAWRACIAL